MKKNLTILPCCLAATLLSTSAYSAVTSSFLGQGGLYDGNTSVDVALFDADSSVNFTMTVSSTGGNLNSNATGLGVGDSKVNTGEMISISFNVDTEIVWLDFGEVSADVSDGVTVTIGANPSFDLYTGQPQFDGNTDVWTPVSPVALSAGEVVTISSSSATAIVDADALRVTAVPEPTTSILLGFGGLVGLSRRKRSTS